MASLGAGVGMGVGMGVGVSVKSRRMNLTSMATGKNARGSVEEKGPFDWVLSGMQKDHLLETDPILKKTDDDKSSGTGSRRGPISVTTDDVKKKFPGFGGLFSKN